LRRPGNADFRFPPSDRPAAADCGRRLAPYVNVPAKRRDRIGRGYSPRSGSQIRNTRPPKSALNNPRSLVYASDPAFRGKIPFEPPSATTNQGGFRIGSAINKAMSARGAIAANTARRARSSFSLELSRRPQAAEARLASGGAQFVAKAQPISNQINRRHQRIPVKEQPTQIGIR
jgi:hypothetical protein